MKRNWFLRVFKVVAMIAVAVTVFGFATMELWNWLMPAIFGLRAITFLQAVGLVVLTKILLGGPRPPWAGRRLWRQHMEDRWARMTPEERERFQAGMRGRWGCGWNPRGETATGSRPE
jgi:hypothetical protein